MAAVNPLWDYLRASRVGILVDSHSIAMEGSFPNEDDVVASAIAGELLTAREIIAREMKRLITASEDITTIAGRDDGAIHNLLELVGSEGCFIPISQDQRGERPLLWPCSGRVWLCSGHPCVCCSGGVCGLFWPYPGHSGQ